MLGGSGQQHLLSGRTQTRSFAPPESSEASSSAAELTREHETAEQPSGSDLATTSGVDQSQKCDDRGVVAPSHNPSQNAGVERYDPNQKVTTVFYDASLPVLSKKEKTKYVIDQLDFRTKESRRLKATHQKLFGSGQSSRRDEFIPAQELEKRKEQEERFLEQLDTFQEERQIKKTHVQAGKGYRLKQLITPEQMGAPIGSAMPDPQLNSGGKYSPTSFKAKNTRSMPLVHPKLAPGFYSPEFEKSYNFKESDVREHSARGHGPGGQATNRRMQTCVLFHEPSRIQIKTSKHRSLWANRKAARILLNFRVENWMFKDDSREGQWVAEWRERQKREDEVNAKVKAAIQEQQQLKWWKFRDFLEGKERIPNSVMEREGPAVMGTIHDCFFSRIMASVRGGAKAPANSDSASDPKRASENRTPVLGCQDFLNELTPSLWWTMLSGGSSATRTLDEQSQGKYARMYPNTAAAGEAVSADQQTSHRDNSMVEASSPSQQTTDNLPPAVATPFTCVPVWFNYLFPCKKKPQGAECCPDGLIKLLKERFKQRRPVNVPPQRPAPPTRAPAPVSTPEAATQDDETMSPANDGEEDSENQQQSIEELEEDGEAGSIPNCTIAAYDDWERRHTEELLQELDATTCASLEAEIADCSRSEDAKRAVVKFLPAFFEMFGLRLTTRLVEKIAPNVPPAPSTDAESTGESSEAPNAAKVSSTLPSSVPKKKLKKRGVLKKVLVKRRIPVAIGGETKGNAEKTEPANDEAEGQEEEEDGAKAMISKQVIELDGFLWLEQRGRLMMTSTNNTDGVVIEPHALVVGLFVHLLCSLDDLGLEQQYNALRDFLYESSSLAPGGVESATSSQSSAECGDSPQPAAAQRVLNDHRVPGGIRLPPWPKDFSDCVHMCLLLEDRPGLV